MKNLSILINHGCIYNCSFCISDSQKTHKEYKFKLQDFRDIKNLLLTKQFTRLSISGGGDPLYIHNEDILFLYMLILNICEKLNIHLSIHTNYQKPSIKLKELDINYVVSIHNEDYLLKLRKWSDNISKNTNVRFTYILGYNKNDLFIINDIIKHLPHNARLTIKQLDSIDDISVINDYDFIMAKIESDPRIRFLPKGDYNLYYNLNENKVYERFKDIIWSK